MKSAPFLLLLAAWVAPSAFANDDLYAPKILATETFQAVLDGENGGVTCRDKVVSGYGTFPGAVWVENSRGPFGPRLRDRGDRTSRITSLSFQLPDAVTCSSIRSELPTGNGWVTVTREVALNLAKVGDQTRLVITEIIKLPLAPDLPLEGRYEWTDFRVPTVEIDLARDITLQLLDRDSWSETVSAKSRPLSDGLDCVAAPINGGKFALTLSLDVDGRVNTATAERLYETESDCMDKLSEIEAEASIDELDNQGFDISIARKLALIHRDRIGDDGKPRSDVVRTESVAFALLGVNFFGVSAIPLWQ